MIILAFSVAAAKTGINFQFIFINPIPVQVFRKRMKTFLFEIAFNDINNSILTMSRSTSVV